MVLNRQKVVILLGTLNGAEFLPEQLQSYCDQSHSNWELLVSDDGSVDRTVDLIEDFARRVPQKVTLRQGPQQEFWNNFLSMVRLGEIDGDFFAFSDQDDVWCKEKLAKAVEWLGAIPADLPALYFGRTILIGRDGTQLGYSPLFTRASNFQNALVQNKGGGNTMVFNRAAREILAKTPSDVTLIAHDWWTYQLVTGVGGIAYYDSWPSMLYRQHEQNLIGSNAGLWQRFIRLRAFLGGRFTQWNDLNVKALNRVRGLLSPASVLILDRFARSRTASGPVRFYLTWRSGVFRQSRFETIILFIGTLLNRV